MSATFNITFKQRSNGKWDILQKLSAKNGSQEEIDMAMELNKLIRDKIHGVRRDGEEKRLAAEGGRAPDLRSKAGVGSGAGKSTPEACGAICKGVATSFRGDCGEGAERSER